MTVKGMIYGSCMLSIHDQMLSECNTPVKQFIFTDLKFSFNRLQIQFCCVGNTVSITECF